MWGNNMTEIDALFKIASAIQNVANAIVGISVVLWLILIFKTMNSNSSIQELSQTIKEKIIK
jgi:uncharacterized membrane protein YuzA (DUF378 family)